MRKLLLMIITASFLLCGCGTKTIDTAKVMQTEISTTEQSTATLPEESTETAEKGEEDSRIEEAKEIESDLKITFMNLIPTDEIKNTLSVQSFPTTYFVNEKGELSGPPVVGSQVYAYRTRMAELLGEGQAE